METKRRTMHTETIGYGELIRTNAHFRWLWIGNMVSLLGDWFNTIAIFDLVGGRSGSPMALAWVLVVKQLPFALASPVAGLIADRFDRRKLMIGLDLARAVLVLGFLWARTQADLPLVYVLSALQVVLGAVFIPARSALLPSVVQPHELLTANTIMNASWSSLLAIGAALGGFASAWLGATFVFVTDSLSYVLSAYCTWKVVVTYDRIKPLEKTGFQTAYQGVLEGWRLMRRTPAIGRIALAKPMWAFGGGALVFMMTILAGSHLALSSSIGIGTLYAVRGLGTGLGPVLARRFVFNQRHWPSVLGISVCLSALGYMGVAVLPWHLGLVVFLVFWAHTPSGANWVLSSVLLQQRSPDAFMGRIFSTEWLFVTFVESLFIIMAGFLLEHQLLNLSQGFFLFACLQFVAGLLWIIRIVPAEKRDSGHQLV